MERTQNSQDLIWGRRGDRFELAIEAAIPDHLRGLFDEKKLDTVRYEVVIGLLSQIGEIGILGEKALLKRSSPVVNHRRQSFPDSVEPVDTILTERASHRRAKTIINKAPGGNDNYYSEVYQESGKGWAPAFKLGAEKIRAG